MKIENILTYWVSITLHNVRQLRATETSVGLQEILRLPQYSSYGLNFGMRNVGTYYLFVMIYLNYNEQ